MTEAIDAKILEIQKVMAELEALERQSDEIGAQIDRSNRLKWALEKELGDMFEGYRRRVGGGK